MIKGLTTKYEPMPFRRYDWQGKCGDFVAYGPNEASAVAGTLWAMGANGTQIAAELNRRQFSAALISRLTGQK